MPPDEAIMATPATRPSGIPVVDLEREAIEDARKLTFAQKFLAGADLFDYATSVTISGIRWQHPDFTDEQVLSELWRRIALGEALERRTL
jgi:hypothetical protein